MVPVDRLIRRPGFLIAFARTVAPAGATLPCTSRVAGSRSQRPRATSLSESGRTTVASAASQQPRAALAGEGQFHPARHCNITKRIIRWLQNLPRLTEHDGWKLKRWRTCVYIAPALMPLRPLSKRFRA